MKTVSGPTVFRAVLLGLLAGGLLAGDALAARNLGRVTGRVADADGKPITGLVLSFTPLDPGIGDPRTVETNKKARFSDLRFPAGDWTVDPRVGEYFLESLTYILLDKDGLKKSTWGAKSHPKDGFPAFKVPAGATIRLDLVAAEPELGEKLDKGTAWAQNADVVEGIGELFNAGKLQETLDATEALLQKEPDLGPALYLRGAALNRLGRREEAIADLRRARELMPDQPGIGGMLGEAVLARALEAADQGDADGARALAGEAAGLLAPDVEGGDGVAYGRRWNYTLALKTAGRDADMRESLEQLIERHPDKPDPFQELAELQFQDGRQDQALATLERMPPTGATNGAILLFNQALKLFDDEKPDEALELLKRAKTMDPAFVMSYNLEGQILLSKGDKPGAAEALRRFIELAPEGADTSSAKRTLEALDPAGQKE